MLKFILTSLTFLFFATGAFCQLATDFWDNGQKRAEGKIVEGNRDSTWHTWNEKGHLTWTGHYDKGIPAGEWTFYRDSALIERRITWQEGGLKEWTRFFRFDTTEMFTTINFVEPVNPTFYGEFTQLEQGIYDELYKYMQADILAVYGEVSPENVRSYFYRKFGWYQNSVDGEFESMKFQNRKAVWRIDTLRRSKIQKFWLNKETPFVLEYFEKENTVLKLEYGRDDLSSYTKYEYQIVEPYELYRRTLLVYDKIREEKLNFTGPKSYYQKTYYPSGELESEGFFKEGEKHGKWKYYDKEGNRTRKEKYKNGVLK